MLRKESWEILAVNQMRCSQAVLQALCLGPNIQEGAFATTAAPLFFLVILTLSHHEVILCGANRHRALLSPQNLGGSPETEPELARIDLA